MGVYARLFDGISVQSIAPAKGEKRYMMQAGGRGLIAQRK